MKLITLNCGNSTNFGDQAIGKTMKSVFSDENTYVDNYDLFLVDSIDQGYKEDVSIPTDYLKVCLRKKSVAESIANALKWAIRKRKFIHSISKKRYDMLIIGGGELIQSNGIFAFCLWYWAKK